MGIVSIKKEVREITVEDKVMFAPIVIVAGKHHFFSHLGNIVKFDTKKEAEEYNEL